MPRPATFLVRAGSAARSAAVGAHRAGRRPGGLVAAQLAPAVLAGRLTAAKGPVAAAGVLVLAAAGLAYLVAVVQSMFTGGTETRALGATIAGVGVSVLAILAGKFGAMFTWVCGRPLERNHIVALIIMTALFVPLGLWRDGWLPGVVHDCYTPPTSRGMTVLVQAPGGSCYGLLDTPDAGPFAHGSFGRHPVASELQRRLLEANRPLEDGDLTVVWLGSLSCKLSEPDRDHCADGRDYPAEREQLRGLLLAQTQIARDTDHRMHVVIADAAQDVEHADDVAQLIVARRRALGGRLAVVGGGDSRDVTQRAINRLLDHGVPFIAPNLLGDLGNPGQPFVQRPGYLQLSAPNQAYAVDTVNRLHRSYPRGFRLDVFQIPNPTDQYTTSLVNDLLAAVKAAPGPHGRTAARHVHSLDQLSPSICRGSRTGPPTVAFFADRWIRFGEFLRRVNDVCGFTTPEQIIASGSVSRFMASDSLRAQSNAAYPIDYYVGGLRCSDLKAVGGPEGLAVTVNEVLRPPTAFTCEPDPAEPGPVSSSKGTASYCSLDAAESVSQPCPPNDLGIFVAPAWDAALLADALLPPRRANDLPADRGAAAAYLRALQLGSLQLTQGVAQVRAGTGTLTGPTIPVELWRVAHVADPTETPRRSTLGTELRDG